MKTEKFKFISEVLTTQNPKDIYYVNKEESFRQYTFILFLGLLFILYMIIG